MPTPNIRYGLLVICIAVYKLCFHFNSRWLFKSEVCPLALIVEEFISYCSGIGKRCYFFLKVTEIFGVL